jgi:beta-phosphoglucomutase-like phosphatase (HAD superfamily)
MIRVVMLNLEGTLVHGDQVLPHVPEALQALAEFDTSADEELPLCLVANSPIPASPSGEAVKAIFHDFLARLDRLGLADFFDPAEERVTLAAHAGALLPDRKVFETALRRLGLEVSLSECLFITHEAADAAAGRGMGMQVLRFGPPDAPGVDFSDWSEAPLLVARRVAPADDRDLELALNTRLAVTHRLQVSALTRRPGSNTVHAQTTTWCPLSGPRLGALGGVHVQLPVPAEIRLDSQGRVASVKTGEPSGESMHEAADYVRTLAANNQVGLQPGSLPPGATHQVETDDRGRRYLKRTRFSAL